MFSVMQIVTTLNITSYPAPDVRCNALGDETCDQHPTPITCYMKMLAL